jgi:hypothetical protein
LTTTKKQFSAIRGYVRQGLSANKIQKKLQKQGLGIRRKTLLAEVRKIKGKTPKLKRQKYTPKKYQKRARTISRRPRIIRHPLYFGKHVAVYRYASTKRHPKPYSARFEFYGSGKDLAKAVRLVYNGIVPQYEYPFVEVSARDFLSNPYAYGERGIWTARPEVES